MVIYQKNVTYIQIQAVLWHQVSVHHVQDLKCHGDYNELLSDISLAYFCPFNFFHV